MANPKKPAFLTKEEINEEMRDFREAWKKERKRYGDFVPHHRLYTTGIIMHYLMKRGLVETDGAGYAPVRR